jgi:glycine/D-amino acid oxidase-like deaminating enzyme
MSTTQPSHVAVIGGGIFGASTAAQLARRGVRVTLLTESALASGASGRSLAWLNSAGFRSPEYHALRVAGIDRYRTWSARVPGSDAYLRFEGGLTWAPEGDSFAETFAYERSIGYDARWLAADEIAAVTPGVDPASVAAEGAIFNPGEGWVDLPAVIEVLMAELVERGGTVVTDAGDVQPLVEDGRVVGVVIGGGDRVDADAVVLATGPAVPEHLARLGVTVETQSPAAFVAFTKPVDTELVTVLNTPRVAVRRMPDGALALDSAWSEEEIEVTADGELIVHDSTVERLLEEGSRVVAGNPKLELDHIGAGYKPIPGDGEPVIGAVEAIDGLYAAFSHSGATLGLITGELLAEEIVTGTPSPLLATFRPERFVRDEALTAAG